MKHLLTTLLILTRMVGAGQNNTPTAIFIPDEPNSVKEWYESYIKHCNEIVTDTIEEYGEVEATKEVPVYDGCEQIIGYRSIPAKDTTWKGYKCPEWKTVYTSRWGVAIDSLSTLSTYYQGEYILSVENGVIKRKIWPGSCKVSRKHACQVKREKPSQEGFYEWLWGYLSNKK